MKTSIRVVWVTVLAAAIVLLFPGEQKACDWLERLFCWRRRPQIVCPPPAPRFYSPTCAPAATTYYYEGPGCATRVGEPAPAPPATYEEPAPGKTFTPGQAGEQPQQGETLKPSPQRLLKPPPDEEPGAEPVATPPAEQPTPLPEPEKTDGVDSQSKSGVQTRGQARLSESSRGVGTHLARYSPRPSPQAAKRAITSVRVLNPRWMPVTSSPQRKNPGTP